MARVAAGVEVHGRLLIGAVEGALDRIHDLSCHGESFLGRGEGSYTPIYRRGGHIVTALVTLLHHDPRRAERADRAGAAGRRTLHAGADRGGERGRRDGLPRLRLPDRGGAARADGTDALADLAPVRRERVRGRSR